MPKGSDQAASGWQVEGGYRVYPPKVNMCGIALDRQVEAGLGDRPALRFDRGEWTYRELEREVGLAAAGLLALGIGRGDRILFRSRNVPPFCATLLAAFKVGAVAVLSSTLLKDDDLAYILDNSGARVAVTLEEFAEPLRTLQSQGRLDRLIVLDAPSGDGDLYYEALKVRAGPPPATAETGATEPALLLYSSGTTGRPKGILHGHRWIIAAADVIELQMQYAPGDVVMTPGEFSFMATFGHCLMTPLANGATCALYAARPAPAAVLAAIAEHRVTKFMSVPTFYRTVLATPDVERDLDLSCVRLWVSGGEALGASVIAKWERRFGLPLNDMYGISELEVLIGNSPANPIKPGSIGKLLPGVKLALLDGELKEVPVDAPGRAMVHRSDPGLFLEYYRQWDKWRLAHCGDWYDTGDVLRRDADGYYWYLGRDDDLFKSRGMFVSPQEIENTILGHGGVVEVAVLGLPDERVGHRICAFVVPAAGAPPAERLREELVATVAERLARHKVPEEIRFVDSLPKNVVGKIVRRRLLESAGG